MQFRLDDCLISDGFLGDLFDLGVQGIDCASSKWQNLDFDPL